MFSLFGAVLGLSWGPCWPLFWSRRTVLNASLAILGLANAGQARSGQVRSGQNRSRSICGSPGSGLRPGLGRKGFPGHIRMGLKAGSLGNGTGWNSKVWK